MKKGILYTCLSLVVILSFAGCGKSDKSTPNVNQSGSASQSKAASEDNKNDHKVIDQLIKEENDMISKVGKEGGMTEEFRSTHPTLFLDIYIGFKYGYLEYDAYKVTDKNITSQTTVKYRVQFLFQDGTPTITRDIEVELQPDKRWKVKTDSEVK